MFSIDQWLTEPPASLILSILLIAGFDFCGLVLLRKLGLLTQTGGWTRWQAPLIGTAFAAVILYPLALTNLTPKFFIQLVACALCAAGLTHLIRIAHFFYLRTKSNQLNWRLILDRVLSQKLFVGIVLGMGLVAMGPETSADALDYHLGIAIAILNHGGMPVVPEWFMGRLAGNGEVLNAIGLSIGAEQFGSLLQFVSLIGIVAIIKFAPSVRCNQNENSLSLIALAAVSAPVLLFLVSSSKPQLWPTALTTLAFTLVVHPSRNNLARRDVLVGFTVICTLVMTASQAKFNHLLGGGVVGIIAMFVMMQRRYFLSMIIIPFCAATAILLPPVLWKAKVYNASWLDSLTKPWPGGLPGTEKMDFAIRYLMNGDSPLPFPLSMLIPTAIGQFTTVLGIGALIILGLRPQKNVLLWAGIVASAAVVLVNAFIAPHIARMYLEPYFWLLIVVALQPSRNFLHPYIWLRWPIYCQGAIMLGATWIGVGLLFPGALTSKWRAEVMRHYAVDYAIMEWANTKLPQNAVLLNGQRSMALTPRKSISTEWLSYVDAESSKATIYLNTIKNNQVTHILLTGATFADLKNHPLEQCFGKSAEGPGIARFVTRNPFNHGGKYEGWLIEFDSARLPDCAYRKSTVRKE